MYLYCNDTETTVKPVKVTITTQRSNNGDFCLSVCDMFMVRVCVCMCTDVQVHGCTDVEARGWH